MDLEVAEEGVCAEQAQDLVEDIVGLGVGVGREVGCKRGIDRERICRSTDFGAERQEGEVPYELWGGFFIEDAVVCLDHVNIVGIGRAGPADHGRKTDEGDVQAS